MLMQLTVELGGQVKIGDRLVPSSMVKRSCPFNDYMNPQLKVHVREKEVAAGVMSDLYMKDVYDRTKDLLFRGAKKSAPLGSDQNQRAILNSGIASCNSTISLKQTQLTNCQGQLSTSKGVGVSSDNQNTPCSKCSMWNSTEMSACFFCDVTLCMTCLQTCRICNDLFCSACCFNLYDALEGYVCRNCC